ncbi:STAS domain-containing protein [Streptacidiphilus sp. N1-3]|uniref:STAS domain-containing protein n=1 Tax=Streptacidiphilus alkalitolerans TaxID=3342712 RepID=A0ABV6XBA2_9ACTN
MATDNGPSASYQVVAPRGDLDTDTLGPLAAELDDAAARHPVVILDASGITFSDSSFLRLVLLTHRRTELRIAAAPPAVARLFQLISVDAMLHLYPTLDAARAA